jgi:CRP-like cAMP-binding protein
MQFEDILVKSGEEQKFVFFPLTCFISQILINDDIAIEVALTGDEGMFGLGIALGIARSPVMATVQGAGDALRMSAASFAAEMRDTPALRKLVLRYAHVCLAQSALHISCARFHSVEQRVARWLLMTADRARSLSFRMTQRLLAYVIGVRRVGVTNAASALQDRGLVSYSRGAMQIVDVDGLRGVSCRCYQDDLDIYSNAMGADPVPLKLAPAPMSMAEALPVSRVFRMARRD